MLVFSIFAGLASARNIKIPKNTPGLIKNAKDLGATNPSTVISVTVWLNLQNEIKLDQLVKQQYQKGSGTNHKWITQDQFNATFGPSAQSVKSVQNFLTAHKLTVLEVAENNMYVKAQGTVGTVEKAFQVQIDNFAYQWPDSPLEYFRSISERCVRSARCCCYGPG
jgi:subtilase family serine protease